MSNRIQGGPVALMTAADMDVWLNGTLEEALKLQKPQPDDTIVITPNDQKKVARTPRRRPS